MSLTDITADYERIKKTFMDQLQETMKKEFTAFLTNYPEIEAITWVQYTPHFNDGEPCEFSVHDFWHIAAKEFYEDEDEYEEAKNASWAEEYQVFDQKPSTYVLDDIAVKGTESRYYRDYQKYNDLPTRVREVNDAWDKFRKELGKVPDEVFQAMFDDGVKVTATLKGFDVDEYDHD